ncbi:MAG: RNA polymerase sigma factor [Planctomycetota bacterium]|jgi:RNA polymerase sigma-70 factor (ECF subfamily)
MSKEAIYNQLLVLRCQSGQAPAWDELVGRWEKPLIYYIRRMVDDEPQAWQILQEVWLQVVKNIHTLRRPEYLPKWLYSICHHKIVSYYRKSHRQAEFQTELCQEAHRDNHEPDVQFENAEAVHWGLEKLKPVFREVLTLFFLQDLSVEEIAEVLDVPAGTVKSRLYYAKKQLRDVLEDHHV